MTRGSEDFRTLHDALIQVFRAGVGRTLPDDEFNELALRVFRFQARKNPLYAGLCHGRGLEVEGVARWEEIPPVPTRAFKHFDLVSGSPETVEAVFRTSGTTGGAASRGEHHVRSLELYRQAALPNFRAHLLPDGRQLPLVSLVPSPADLPDSSLSRMTAMVEEAFARPGGGWFVDSTSGIRSAELDRAISQLQDQGRPILLMATAFALVHWLDAMDGSGRRYALPLGSRIMETGGFKGKSRVVERAELYREIHDKLGVPPNHVVNEYGMTELLSQFYEPILSQAHPDPESGGDAEPPERWHVAPPWVRTRVLDPSTLKPVEPGQPGILHHLDLANLGSIASVLTEDFGLEAGGGFQLLGRAPGAEPRGCSLAMDELLEGGWRGSGGRR